MRKTRFFAVGALAFAGLMAGCAQSGDDTQGVGPGSPPGAPGNGGGVNGPGDVANCSVPLGGVCVLAGSEGSDGLVDDLLRDGGALAPIADNINTEDLENALQTLLASDGDLESLVTNLLMEGQLEEGLMELLTGGEDGEGGLADILADLLVGTDEGEGLAALLGEDGVQGLVTALLVEPTDPDCQVPLGTLCLITGDGSQQGLVDVLITEDGALAQISQNLSQDELVAILSNTLESDGSLQDLVTGLIQDGQLAAGLEALLIGDPDAGVQSGLVQALEGLLTPDLVTDLVDLVAGLLGQQV
ncbi:hypothetical protein [Algiphilus sp.]|uniref:hypothetical protein n=1 Tax=Algiphilus sp. TaxID=1872431 RepID=UPI003B526D8C